MMFVPPDRERKVVRCSHGLPVEKGVTQVLDATDWRTTRGIRVS